MTETTKIAFLVTPEGIEQAELVEPWKAVQKAGYEPVLLSTETGLVQMFEHVDKADTQKVDALVTDVQPEEFAALVLPGGAVNADAMRIEKDAIAFVKEFVGSGKPTAVICHAPWALIEAGVVEGRTLTSWPTLQTDLRNAGATWVDKELVEDGNLLTSRKPEDLPAFIEALLTRLG